MARWWSGSASVPWTARPRRPRCPCPHRRMPTSRPACRPSMMAGHPGSTVRLYTYLSCRVIINLDKGPVVVKVGAPSLHDDLQQIAALQGRLPAPVALLIGLAAAMVSLPPLWLTSRYLYTMAHEGGHAFMASVAGLRVTSVTMKRNGDGLTEAAGKGFGVFLFQFFGYLGP